MGLLSILSHLFGTSTNNANQEPASLGRERESETGKRYYNLGEGISSDLEDILGLRPEIEQVQELKLEAEKVETPKEESTKAAKKAVTYNLIILDESGSMYCVREQTISGCNETLNSIRKTAEENDCIKQYVSIFCFDNCHSRYLFKNVPIEETHDLTLADYRPNRCTPLYDAIGYTVTQLQQVVLAADSVGLVTIITDGLENASQRWTQFAVVQLIESLKKKGWVFTFIGANIDVERTAKGLGIDSYLEFEQSDEGMSRMFEEERRSRSAYYSRRFNMINLAAFNALEEEEQKELFGASNNSYFVERERISSPMIVHLKKNEVFVFGSNVMGLHDGGASLYAAEHFGAVRGQAEGFQGQSYAIPTVGNTFDELKAAIEHFNEFVLMHPQFKFMLTEVGCGSAGYTCEQIAPLFRKAYSFGNVYVPKSFLQYVKEKINF